MSMGLILAEHCSSSQFSAAAIVAIPSEPLPPNPASLSNCTSSTPGAYSYAAASNSVPPNANDAAVLHATAYAETGSYAVGFALQQPEWWHCGFGPPTAQEHAPLCSSHHHPEALRRHRSSPKPRDHAAILTDSRPGWPRLRPLRCSRLQAPKHPLIARVICWRKPPIKED